MPVAHHVSSKTCPSLDKGGGWVVALQTTIFVILPQAGSGRSHHFCLSHWIPLGWKSGMFFLYLTCKSCCLCLSCLAALCVLVLVCAAVTAACLNSILNSDCPFLALRGWRLFVIDCICTTPFKHCCGLITCLDLITPIVLLHAKYNPVLGVLQALLITAAVKKLLDEPEDNGEHFSCPWQIHWVLLCKLGQLTFLNITQKAHLLANCKNCTGFLSLTARSPMAFSPPRACFCQVGDLQIKWQAWSSCLNDQSYSKQQHQPRLHRLTTIKIKKTKQNK